jgi:DNA replication protein DnaC
MNDALHAALTKLRLSGLAQSLDVRLQEAQGNSLNHAEFLELILQDELAVRNERLIARRVKAATFREPKTLEDFDWQFNPSIKKKAIFDLATGRFIREARDVLFLGPPGMVTYCYTSLQASNKGISEVPSACSGRRWPLRAA